MGAYGIPVASDTSSWALKSKKALETQAYESQMACMEQEFSPICGVLGDSS